MGKTNIAERDRYREALKKDGEDVFFFVFLRTVPSAKAAPTESAMIAMYKPSANFIRQRDVDRARPAQQ
eukprot:576264-Pyramimonas_sp.AAC.1